MPSTSSSFVGCNYHHCNSVEYELNALCHEVTDLCHNAQARNNREFECDQILNTLSQKMESMLIKLNTGNSLEEERNHLLHLHDSMIMDMWFHMKNYDMHPQHMDYDRC